MHASVCWLVNACLLATIMKAFLSRYFVALIRVVFVQCSMFSIKYLAMHRVQMHAGAISSYCMGVGVASV